MIPMDGRVKFIFLPLVLILVGLGVRAVQFSKLLQSNSPVVV